MINHYLLVAIVMAVAALPAFAVTDKEMDEARAITAKAYLRYANDGSGYLDEFKVSSMSELEGKLKQTEKKNLEAFKSVPVPTDYASWDKAKLVEFWGTTFFTSPKLTDKGKIARSTVRRRLQAMSVAAPSPKAETPAATPAPTETPVANEPAAKTQEPAASTPAEPAAAVANTPAAEPSAQEVIADTEALLAEQEEMTGENMRRERRNASAGSSTWIYVLILVVLIGLMIWLVIYATRLMKGSSEGAGDDSSESNARLSRELADKEDKLNQLKSRLKQVETERDRLSERVPALSAENNTLRQQVDVLQRSETKMTEAPRRTAAPSAAPEERRTINDVAGRRAPRKPEILHDIFLGRANPQGLFVRADRRPSPGNSVYELYTQDGLVGTFRLIDDPEVLDMIFEDPKRYLAGGCTGADFETADQYSDIVTLSAGTAIFEDNCWKVLRKARIAFQ